MDVANNSANGYACNAATIVAPTKESRSTPVSSNTPPAARRTIGTSNTDWFNPAVLSDPTQRCCGPLTTIG